MNNTNLMIEMVMLSQMYNIDLNKYKGLDATTTINLFLKELSTKVPRTPAIQHKRHTSAIPKPTKRSRKGHK